jgi:hypothetical protein
MSEADNTVASWLAKKAYTFEPEEGGPCYHAGCSGKLEFAYVGDGCSCHINPPCGYCASSYFTCLTCGWEETHDR